MLLHLNSIWSALPRSVSGSHLSSAVMIALVMLISGCLQGGGSGAGGSSGEPISPDDYVYKGRVDPLLSIPGSERADALQKRFMQIQGRE